MLPALLLLPLAMGAGAAAPAASAKPTVTGVVAERQTFWPEAGQKATWRFRTSAQSKVRASIYDARDLMVRALLKGDEVPAGDQRLSWDGLDDSGRVSPAGYYLLVIESAAGGETARYDPTEITGGEPTQASAVRFDAARGMVSYALQKPSLVRIHLGLKGDGPLLRTLVDWVARGPGEHAEAWDGWDVSGVIRFGDSPGLDVQVWAYALPINAVVIEPPPTAAPPPKPVVPAALKPAPPAAAPTHARAAPPERPRFLTFPEGRPARPRGTSRAHEMYNHWLHDRTRCHNPDVGLVVAEGARGAQDGARDGREAVTVSAPLPLRLELRPEEASFLQDERFEAVIYLDGVFAFEEEQGYLPFTWSLKPEMLTPGEHVVTFMVRGYEGHFGSSSIRVLRPKGAAAAATGR